MHHRIILFQFGIAAYVETTNFLLDVSAAYSSGRRRSLKFTSLQGFQHFSRTMRTIGRKRSMKQLSFARPGLDCQAAGGRADFRWRAVCAGHDAQVRELLLCALLCGFLQRARSSTHGRESRCDFSFAWTTHQGIRRSSASPWSASDGASAHTNQERVVFNWISHTSRYFKNVVAPSSFPYSQGPALHATATPRLRKLLQFL